MKEIIDLVDISKYAGERIDLVQAGGGNSSVKLDNGNMLIKASGYSLSEIEVSYGYSNVLTSQISEIVKNEKIITEKSKRKRENIASVLVKKATIDTKNRPSIETLLHSFLLKYTLHTHPISVNIILAKKGWKNIIKEPSILYNKEKHTIKLHFDMFHGYGIIDKAISVMNEKDKKDFKTYVHNSRKFNPHIRLCRKN